MSRRRVLHGARDVEPDLWARGRLGGSVEKGTVGFADFGLEFRQVRDAFDGRRCSAIDTLAHPYYNCREQTCERLSEDRGTDWGCPLRNVMILLLLSTPSLLATGDETADTQGSV